MKRILTSALLALAMLSIPLAAHAGHWYQQELGWRMTSQGSPTSATAIYYRDTLYTVVAAGQTDTTVTFGLTDASVWRKHDGAATTVDTCTVAYVLIQQDSAGVAASTLAGITCEVDGRVGGYSGNTKLGNWMQVDSLVVKPYPNPTPSVISIPLRAIGGLGYPDGENAGNFFYRIMSFAELRVRLTPTAGLMSACRVFLRYWVDN